MYNIFFGILKSHIIADCGMFYTLHMLLNCNVNFANVAYSNGIAWVLPVTIHINDCYTHGESFN
jgi:hypothetical protein